MRSIRLPVLSFLLSTAVLLAACKATPPPQATTLAPAQDFTDSGLSLRLPEGWQVRERQGSLRVIAQPMQDGKPVENVYFFYSQDRAPTAANGAPPPGLDSYVRRRESLIQAVPKISGYRVVTSAAATLDGVAAERHAREYTLNEQAPTKAVSVMTVRGRCGYEFAGSAPAEQAARWQPTFDAIIASLRWLPPTSDCQ